MQSQQITQSNPTPSQLQWLNKTLKTELNIGDWQLQPPIADASFRAYSRVIYSQGSYMLMYFPPTHEDGETIVATSKFLINSNIRVPRLIDYDLDVGALLQEDMGTKLLFNYNNGSYNNNASRNEQQQLQLYQQSLQQLELLQGLDATEFGYFDHIKQMNEMQLFSEWFIDKWLSMQDIINPAELEALYSKLAKEVLTAPQCCIHLDFHSRNLCVVAGDSEHENIGILDYQDLLQGHFCYDIWSLLKDAYVRLPEKMSQTLLHDFSQISSQRFAVSDEYINLHYNLIGVQRCLKVCGIFSRLFLRDGKEHYLPHIPLVLEYLETAVTWLINQGLVSNASLKKDLQNLASNLPQLRDATERKLSSTSL